MDNDITVVYYTSNREDEAFEAKIRRTLLDTIDGLPLISVSQKPIDFGENICVGDVGVSGQNAQRQMQLGAKAAKTRFVCVAEADMLYPREYFDFRPEATDRIYTADSVYVLWPRGWFYHKRPSHCEGAIVADRDLLIATVDEMYDDRGMWCDGVEGRKEARYMFHERSYERFHTTVPIITWKTSNGMHYASPIDRRNSVQELPHWGTAGKLRGDYR